MKYFIWSNFLLTIASQVLSPQSSNPELRIKAVSETEARKYIYYPFASYCREQRILEWTCSPYCKGDRRKIRTKYMYNQFFNVTGFTAIDDNEKLIVMSFRGSKNIQNWISNFDIILWPILIDDKFMLVHRGIWFDAYSIYEQIRDGLIWAKSQRPDYPILFTGHSLGGAIAEAALLMARVNNLVTWKETKLITYSAPRLGDVNFKDFLNSKEILSTRVIHPQDIVPNLPPEPVYKHHEYPLLAAPMSNGVNCGIDKIIDLAKCLFKDPQLFDFYHKYFWGEYYNTDC